jgi:hypothetical protein
MPCCETANPGPTPRSERRSHGRHTGCDEQRLKAVSRRRRGRDSARLEPALDAANPSAITSTLDVQDSRSLVVEEDKDRSAPLTTLRSARRASSASRGTSVIGRCRAQGSVGHKACHDNRSVLYQRIPRMFGDLALARGDGRYPRLMRALGGVKLLILDDWGLEPLGLEQRHDMLEIVEDRYGRGATLITSQIPVDRWHDLIGDPTTS